MSHNPATTEPFVARLPFRNRGALNLAAALGRRVKTSLHHWQKHRAVRTLQQLDDWTLNDIGLSRNEIRRFVGDVVVPDPGKISPAPMGHSPMRSEERGSITANGRLHIRDVREKRRHLDAYLSWRDL